MSDNINEILTQLGEAESTDITLSDLMSVVHKSLIYSQHNIRFTELEELKNQYDVEVDETTEAVTLTHKTINIDGLPVNETDITKQNSLSINTATVKMKVNLGNIIDRDNKKRPITASKKIKSQVSMILQRHKSSSHIFPIIMLKKLMNRRNVDTHFRQMNWFYL